MAEDSSWTIKFKTPGGEQQVQLVLGTTENGLTGTFDGAAIKDGRANDNEISFNAELTSPFQMKIKFSASIDGDTMTGKAKAAMMTIPFTGTREGA